VTALPLADFDGVTIPDYAEPVEAWRVWRVGMRAGGVVLKSLFANAVWEPCVPLAAKCAGGHRSLLRPWRVTLNDHPSPELDCTCGIYGVATPVAAREYLDPRRFLLFGDRVIGRVALWGDVVEGELGWRASRAYPLELLIPVPAAEGGGYRRRAHLDEIAVEVEAYSVPVDFVGPRLTADVFR
jgi:hypothetical protein